jgi:hypothetical protein
MLPAPKLFISKVVKELRQLEVALKLKGGILSNWVVWRQKGAESQICQVRPPESAFNRAPQEKQASQ